MMTPKDGFEKSLQLCKTEFGKKHDIARRKQLAASNYDGLMTLSTDMQKCYTTLNEIGYMSDINSTQTLYATMPTQVRQKWVDKYIYFLSRDIEPKFTDLITFINEQSIAVK